MPIADHFRWKVDRRLKEEHARGDQFQVTWMGWTIHGFTHVDTPRHIAEGGATTTDIPLESLIGAASVIDLSDVPHNRPIAADLIAERGAHVRPGDIALLKTCWDLSHSVQSREFWMQAPWLTREGCEWLYERGIKALAVDFPQDEPIRYLLDGVVKPISEYVSHDVLLRRGVPLIEYVCNLGALKRPRVEVYALPLKILDADGSPVRVIAMEHE